MTMSSSEGPTRKPSAYGTGKIMISAVAASSQFLLGSIYKLGDEVFGRCHDKSNGAA
jgi:hypothetical protein